MAFDKKTKLVYLNVNISGDLTPHPNVCYSLVDGLLVTTPIFTQ